MIEATLRKSVVSGELLNRAIEQGRKFTGAAWYIEPKRFDGSGFAPSAASSVAVRVQQKDAPDNPLDTQASPIPPAFYVIVGCGAAAVVNHTTLRQTEFGWNRIDRLPVVHLGFEDPWKHYRNHQMGQIANLLQLPGFHRSPFSNGENLTQPRWSQNFAADVAAEWKDLGRAVPFGWVPAWLALIQARDKPVDYSSAKLKALKDEMGLTWSQCETLLKLPFPAEYPPYRLLAIDQTGLPRLLYAGKVDVCTGNGRPRISFPKRTEATKTYGARPWQPPESWEPTFRRRTLLSGLEALCQETEWPADEHICVIGSGGVGVNMVEIAQETSGVSIDWLASGTTHLDSFFNPRNDPLLKTWIHPLPANLVTSAGAIRTHAARATAAMAIGGLPADMRTDVTCLLIPAEARSRFMQRVYAAGPTGLAQYAAPLPLVLERYPDDLVREAKVKPLPTLGVDSAGNISDLDPSGRFPLPDGKFPAYRRVILCSGQDPRAAGQALEVTQSLTLSSVITGPDKRLVGLALDDGAVRVVGSAAIANQEWVKLFPEGEAALNKLTAFAATIPAQAGSATNLALFALNTLNVAYANQFFSAANPNRNVNLAAESELKELLNEEKGAAEICAKRKTTANGYRNRDEIIKEIWAGFPPLKLDAIKHTYSAALPFVPA